MSFYTIQSSGRRLRRTTRFETFKKYWLMDSLIPDFFSIESTIPRYSLEVSANKQDIGCTAVNKYLSWWRMWQNSETPIWNKYYHCSLETNKTPLEHFKVIIIMFKMSNSQATWIQKAHLLFFLLIFFTCLEILIIDKFLFSMLVHIFRRRKQLLTILIGTLTLIGISRVIWSDNTLNFSGESSSNTVNYITSRLELHFK